MKMFVARYRSSNTCFAQCLKCLKIARVVYWSVDSNDEQSFRFLLIRLRGRVYYLKPTFVVSHVRVVAEIVSSLSVRCTENRVSLAKDPASKDYNAQVMSVCREMPFSKHASRAVFNGLKIARVVKLFVHYMHKENYIWTIKHASQMMEHQRIMTYQ